MSRLTIEQVRTAFAAKQPVWLHVPTPDDPDDLERCELIQFEAFMIRLRHPSGRVSVGDIDMLNAKGLLGAIGLPSRALGAIGPVGPGPHPTGVPGDVPGSGICCLHVGPAEEPGVGYAATIQSWGVIGLGDTEKEAIGDAILDLVAVGAFADGPVPLIFRRTQPNDDPVIIPAG